jgi:agmatine deiminase
VPCENEGSQIAGLRATTDDAQLMTKRLDADDRCPVRDGLSMPAEWEAHARTWMAWPCRLAPWGSAEGLLRARLSQAAVARAISGFEKVTMAIKPRDVDEARLMLGKGVEIFEIEIDDSWARDSGPIFVTDGRDGVAGVAWRFNAWGNKYVGYDNDAAFARHVIEALDMRRYDGPMVLEGGSICVDGEGTLITTEQCLLNPNRNPNLSRQQIEERLALYLGVTKVIWLGEGLEDDETDGHVDNIACFAAPGRVMVYGPREKGGLNERVMRDNIARLRGARDARGRALEIIELPEPARRDRHDGRRLDASYINFTFANYGIVMPSFDDAMDAVAFAVMEKTFPDRRIVQVNALDIVQGGGGIHCITQQQPTGRALRAER